MQHWYAVQLTSDALAPARQRYVEEGPRRGRRLKSRELPYTVLDKTCRRLGIKVYVPMETIYFTHRRTKERLAKKIQLIPGYGFIHGLPDLEALQGSPGIVGVMTNGEGKPPQIVPTREIDTIQEVERVMAAEAMERDQAYRLASKKYTKEELRQLYPKGTKIIITGEHALQGQEAVVDKHNGRQEIQAMIDFLGGLVTTTVKINQIQIVED